MSEEPRKVVYLHDPQQGHKALQVLWEYAKPRLAAGQKLTVRLGPHKRSLDQNAYFHGICSDIAKSRYPWAGKPRDAAAWKVLLVSGHAIATKEGADVIPGVEGEFLNIRESTALMSKRRSASLIDYALAFCATNGIAVSGPPADDMA